MDHGFCIFLIRDRFIRESLRKIKADDANFADKPGKVVTNVGDAVF